MKKFAVIVLAMFALQTVAACSTMAGLGRDVQKVGRKIEDKAER